MRLEAETKIHDEKREPKSEPKNGTTREKQLFFDEKNGMQKRVKIKRKRYQNHMT